MPTLVGALRVTLGLDSAAFERGATGAQRRATGLRGDLQRLRSDALGMGKVLAASVAAFATGAIVASIKNATMQGLEYASSLGEVAQQLGVTTKELQEYRYAASQVGIEQDTMDKGLQRLTVTLGRVAQGEKGPTEALKRLGFGMAEIDRLSRMTAGEALPLLADRFAKIPTPAGQAALAAELFGAKLGPKFLTLLANGAEGINGLRDAAHDLGIVLSDEQIQNADDTADKLSQLNQVLDARIAGVVADNAKSIYELADALATLAGEALNAAGAWLQTQRVLGQRETMRASARERLARDPRVNDRNRAATERLAFEQIDRRLGVSESRRNILPGGLLTAIDRRVDLSDREHGTGDTSFAGIMRQAIPQNNPALMSQRGGGASAGSEAAAGGGSGGKTGGGRGSRASEAAAVAQAAEDAERRAAAALAGITGDFEDMTDALRGAIDETLPEVRKLMEYREKLAALQGRDIVSREGWDAESLLRASMLGGVDLRQNPFGEPDFEGVKPLTDGMDDVSERLSDMADRADDDAKRIAKSFKEMTEDSLSALSQLSSAIKSGDFLGILEAVIGIGLQLGSMGAFGKGVATRINATVPGYAMGTANAARGLAMVGERGPELVNFGGGERVFNNRDTRAMLGGGVMEIRPSPLFEVWMDGKLIASAPAMMAGGGRAGMAMAAKKRSRQVG